MTQFLNNMDMTFYNQLITQIYLSGKKELEYIFPEIKIAEYMVLHIIAHIDDSKEEKKGYVYLREMAQEMEMTMRQASRLAQEMSDRGLVEWTHDPQDASQGTYLKISLTGQELLRNQEMLLKENAECIIQEIGMDRLKDVFQTFIEVRNVLAKRKQNVEE